ncbi:hypothetical protein EOM82_01095 [bacterium]|nr:hypothetical protein [bacterium]
MQYTNVHWLYYNNNGVNFATGYCVSLGIPTNIGSTKHNDIENFYTLAHILNQGQEEPVWENIDENSLPTLKNEEK